MSATQETVMEFTQVIAGERMAASRGEWIDVRCPSDGAVFARVPRGGERDVDAAVAAARRAFDGAWGATPAAERGRTLRRLGALVEENLGELADLESRDTGKPLRQGIADVRACARYFEFYGSAADQLLGDTIPVPGPFLALTLREPHGVVAGVIPWNYPAQILGRVAGSALAAGNALVVKPAEDACLSVVRIAELALEAGIPAGAFNVVTGLGGEAGAALSGNGDIDFVTFTGSPATGSAIQAAASRRNLGTTMELGGKSPQVVFADADLDAAVPVIVNAIIQNGGQTCSAGSRVLVERSVHEALRERLVDVFSRLEAGPHDGDHDLGAIINPRQLERIRAMTDRAKQDGARLVAEGRIAEGAPKGGFYCKPMLFDGAAPRSELGQDEVFGPVLAMFAFDDEEDAVSLANGTQYGLVAGVWTGDAKRSIRVAKRMRAGQVYVNGYGAGGGIELPFGGFGRSGHGREKGFEGLVHMTQSKTIVVNHDG